MTLLDAINDAQLLKPLFGPSCAEQPKSAIYSEVLPLVNAGRVDLLDLPRLQAQLLGLERRTSRSGRDSVDHGPGAHDDVANAVAGACVGAVADAGPGLLAWYRDEAARVRAARDLGA